MKRDARAVRPECLVCSGSLGEHVKLPGLARCAACGFVTADMTVSDDELEQLYGADYFHGGEYSNYILEAPTLRHNVELRLASLAKCVENARAKSLFEIGCAYGFFLDLARRAFARAEGIDISEDAVRYARNTLGVAATKANFLDHGVGEGFDVYCLWDTIEHLREPGRYIEKIASVIAPGGILALTTGDIGSLNARLRGRRWRMIHPPSHLHYFSSQTLTRLLERHGFEVIMVEHPGVARTLRMIITGVLLLGKPKSRWRASLASFANRLPFGDWSVSLNLFDIMYVIARKCRASNLPFRDTPCR